MTYIKKLKRAIQVLKKYLLKNGLINNKEYKLLIERLVKRILPIYSDTPYSFKIELTFLPRYKKQNKNYYVLFTAININTRFVYAYYAKNKDMLTILDFLIQMESKRIINSLTCDSGSEFKIKEFEKYCTENSISLYFVKGDSHKLGIINRFHRTLKDKLSIYFNTNDTVVWIDIIDKIIYNYNHSVNRGIRIEPYKVNDFIENMIIQNKNKETKLIESKEDIINVGDKIRILLETKIFKIN